ncbi:hypothetical protein [Shewanella sairae]|nr:hypothetical protein [Shewanella sairae]MCL1130487.1 hypothetical protein [Shewanella sairae]
MESHKQNVGSSYIDHNAYLAEWNSVNRIPIGNEGLGGAESNWELISTLNNSCNSATGCTLAKPITDYDEVLVFGRNNGERSRGSVLIPVNEIDFGTRDNADRYHISLSRRSDGNDYVNFYFENPKKLFHYTSMDFYQFAEVYGRGKSKRPKECDAGVVEDLVTYCTEIGQRTCEAGLVKRTCASYGDWLPWETIRLPSCVWGSQDCK